MNGDIIDPWYENVDESAWGQALAQYTNPIPNPLTDGAPKGEVWYES